MDEASMNPEREAVILPQGVRRVESVRLSEILSGYEEYAKADLFEVQSLAYEVRNSRALLREMHKLVQGCSGCDYDEAEGGLFCHCKKCQLKITTRAYELFGVVKS